ncbi:MAG: Stp1/IreP family PP2C-type Ser/Thr phosphatase [Pseudomonadota bacterium]
MIYEICAETDAGRQRTNNEDSVAFDASTGLCVLADGMGGYNAGEVASSLATAFIQAELGGWLAGPGKSSTTRSIRDAMELCVHNANHSIFRAALADPLYSGMGTTVVVAVFREDKLVLGHIGDSRCYRLRGNRLVQLTRDHSLVQEELDAGLITPQQALLSPHRGFVTRALGVSLHAHLEVEEHRVEPGDMYLLCSDGLTDMLDDQSIARMLADSRSLGSAAAELVAAANWRGGRDNISVVLVRNEQLLPKPRLLARFLGQPTK